MMRENDTTLGLARVDVHADGTLQPIWRDPVGGERRCGVVAPNDDMVVLLARDRTDPDGQVARAVRIRDFPGGEIVFRRGIGIVWQRPVAQSQDNGLVNVGCVQMCNQILGVPGRYTSTG